MNNGEVIVVGLPLLICLVGLLIYVLTAPPRTEVKEVGRIMFFVGLFWVVSPFVMSAARLLTH